ncbi:hypothetical protein FACS1894198_5610 [Clostridia bacterium]|nr:hypothetical protein FACS1894198_5610 [Clostridia bacterium]
METAQHPIRGNEAPQLIRIPNIETFTDLSTTWEGFSATYTERILLGRLPISLLGEAYRHRFDRPHGSGNPSQIENPATNEEESTLANSVLPNSLAESVDGQITTKQTEQTNSERRRFSLGDLAETYGNPGRNQAEEDSENV